MAFATVEDLSGSRELVIFPGLYRDTRDLLADTALKLVEARVDVRGDDAKLIAESIATYRVPESAPRRNATRPASALPPASAATPPPQRLSVELPLDEDTRRAQELVLKVFELLTAQRGDVPFRLLLRAPNGSVEMDFPNLGTLYSPDVERGLSSLVGQGHCRWD